MKWTKRDFLGPHATVQGLQPSVLRWIRDGLRRISRARAMGLNPLLANTPPNQSSYYYTCRHFDAESNLCTIFDQAARPYTCGAFPWYGQDQTSDDAVLRLWPYRTCSYWLDVPEELRPDHAAPEPTEDLQESRV